MSYRLQIKYLAADDSIPPGITNVKIDKIEKAAALVSYSVNLIEDHEWAQEMVITIKKIPEET